MGNGRLGIAVWSADGFTAQLNREDTLPHRDSPGQVIIPGLGALTSAKDFAGRLDLYNGTLVEHGGGMTLTAYVQVSTDTFVVDVTGAEPNIDADGRTSALAAPHAQATASGKNRHRSHKPGSTTTAPEHPEKPSAPSPPSQQRAATSPQP